MEELFVYDTSRILIGEISEYESFEEERNYFDSSKLVLRVEFDQFNSSLLKIGNHLSLKSQDFRLYYIDHFGKINENGIEIIEIYAFSINNILKFRAIPQQMRFYGDAGDVIDNFIKFNCVQVSDPNRVIPGLVNGNFVLNRYIDSSKSGGSVFDQVFALCMEVGCTTEILSNHSNQTLFTYILLGDDRSYDQSVNPRVVFSKEFGNVLSSVYFESLITYKNVAIVAGEGEGLDRKVVTVGNYSGLDRRELYVDARDISSTYNDENGDTVTLTEQEYENLLIQRGLEKLKENIAIKNFETVIDDVQYKLGVDYFLGDIVTFIDPDLNVSMNARVVSIKTTSNRKGVVIKPSFGTGVPKGL